MATDGGRSDRRGYRSGGWHSGNSYRRAGSFPEGDGLTPDDGEIYEERLAKAFQTVCNILGYMDQTESKIREKLQKRGYGERIIDDALERAREFGFLDEYRLALHKYRYLADRMLYGKARILPELRQRGFLKETLDRIDPDGEELCDIDFAENCAKLLAKRGGELDQKNYAYLRGHGFSTDDISAAKRILADRAADGKNNSGK